MRGNLIATGGALLVAAAVFSMAGVAAADAWSDERHWHPDNCSLGTNDDSTYHHVTKYGRFAGTRDADACKGGEHGHDSDDDGWGWKHDHGRHNWPGSGNGNWIGHGYGPGAGVGVGG